MSRRSYWCACIVLATALLAAELCFLALPGIQQDEALFVRPFLQGETTLYSLNVGGLHVPAMLMDYIGCLKTWLYWPVFNIWPPGVWSVRLPMCLFSIGTLLLFASLARKVAGDWAAIGSAVLLAFDATFLLTNVFDWGPVALLLAGALGFLALLIRFNDSGNKFILSAAFLLAGAMLWYKAIFIFELTGILAGCALVFPRRLFQRARPANLAIALTALLIGAFPLVLFNLRTDAATLRASRYLEHIPLGEKLMMLRLTLDGRALEHYMVRSVPHEVLQLQGAPLGELVRVWYRGSSLGPGSFLFFALLISGAALPLLRRSLLFKPIAFAWVAALVTEALFLAGGNSGAGPHHTVLLYPAPQFIVAATAVALAERLRGRSRRALVFGVLALITGSSLLLIVNYHRAAVKNGFSVFWTDAERPLAGFVRTVKKPVAFLDWGIEDPDRIECGDTIHVVDASPARENVVYVTHAPQYILAGPNTIALMKDAASHGLTVSASRDIPDTHGNLIFSTFTLSRRNPVPSD